MRSFTGRTIQTIWNCLPCYYRVNRKLTSRVVATRRTTRWPRVPDGGEPRRTSTYVAQAPTPGTWNQRIGDFDHNQIYDCNDIGLLGTAIATGSTNLIFDLSNNFTVDDADLALWLQLAGEVNLGPGRAYLRGDANLDGVVDGIDFITWNSHKFTTGGQWCTGDFTTDGIVDGQDFIVWNSHKFVSSDQHASNRYQFAAIPSDIEFGKRMRPKSVDPHLYVL